MIWYTWVFLLEAIAMLVIACVFAHDAAAVQPLSINGCALVSLDNLICARVVKARDITCMLCDDYAHLNRLYKLNGVKVYVCRKGLSGALCVSTGASRDVAVAVYASLYESYCESQITGSMAHGGTLVFHLSEVSQS